MIARVGHALLLALIGALFALPACDRTKYDREGKPITIGRFRLRTYPKGAKVWVNGELKVEHTPATLVLPAGTYRLRIQAPNAEALEKEVQIEAGESQEVSLRIPPSPPAVLDVFSDMEAADVRINGYKRGETPLLGAVTAPGLIDLTVTAGNVAKSERFRLGISEHKRIEVFFGDVACVPEAARTAPAPAPTQSLPPARALLTVGLSPNGTVEIDEQAPRNTPLVEHPVEPGEHELLLRSKDGHFERRVNVEVGLDEPAVYRFMLGADDEVLGWRPAQP